MTFEQADEVLGLIHENVVQYVGASYFGVEIPELEQDNFGDEDGEDDDYEDDDEEDDDEKAPKAKAGKKGGKDGKKEEECKQN